MKSAWFVTIYGQFHTGYFAEITRLGVGEDLFEREGKELYLAGTRNDAIAMAEKFNIGFQKDGLYYWDKLREKNGQ